MWNESLIRACRRFLNHVKPEYTTEIFVKDSAMVYDIEPDAVRRHLNEAMQREIAEDMEKENL